MPARLIREGILTSEAVNRLNWAEEVFYRRLLSVVDDFGRYYATPKLLRAACYPLHIDKVSDSDIGKWLSACETAALVRVYPAPDGKRYVEVLRFNQQIRAKTSRFPQPPSSDEHMHSRCLADEKQLPSSAHLDVFGDGDVFGDETPAREARFERFWAEYPKKVGKDAARKAFEKRKPDDALTAQMVKAVGDQARSEAWRKDGGQFIPHPATWLNQGRWQDGGVSVISAPAPTGPDPELERLRREAKEATPMPAALRDLTRQLTGRAH